MSFYRIHLVNTIFQHRREAKPRQWQSNLLYFQENMTKQKKKKLKNRYSRSSKLSEYRFLKILKGFAMDMTAKELATDSGISEKSIRANYGELRNKLIEAAIYNRDAFSGAGFYLLRKGKLDDQGKRFLHGVAESEIFTKHVKRHAPRVKTEEDFQGLIFEVVVRVFCNIHLDEGALIDYPEETKQAVLELRNMGQWVRENIQKEGFLEKYGHIVEQFRKVANEMKLLLEKEELLALQSKSKAHRFPWELLYNDLRRHLLKYPL